MPRLFPLPPTTPRPNPPRPSAAPPLPGNVTMRSPTSAGHPKADPTTPATHASGSESAADEASGALHYEVDPEAQQKRNPEKQENVLPAVEEDISLVTCRVSFLHPKMCCSHVAAALDCAFLPSPSILL